MFHFSDESLKKVCWSCAETGNEPSVFWRLMASWVDSGSALFRGHRGGRRPVNSEGTCEDHCNVLRNMEMNVKSVVAEMMQHVMRCMWRLSPAASWLLHFWVSPILNLWFLFFLGQRISFSFFISFQWSKILFLILLYLGTTSCHLLKWN